MAEVWTPDISQEIQRAYDLTTAINASGSTSLSPVYNVGPGADAGITRTQSFALHSNVVAGAAVTGGMGIVIPSTDSRVAVVRSINFDAATAASQILIFLLIPLGTLIEATFAPTLQLMPTNLRNFPNALGPTLGFTTNTTSPPASGIIDSCKVGTNLSTTWHRRYAVIVPNTALMVIVNANNVNYNVDIELDLYQPQTK